MILTPNYAYILMLKLILRLHLRIVDSYIFLSHLFMWYTWQENSFLLRLQTFDRRPKSGIGSKFSPFATSFVGWNQFSVHQFHHLKYCHQSVKYKPVWTKMSNINLFGRLFDFLGLFDHRVKLDKFRNTYLKCSLAQLNSYQFHGKFCIWAVCHCNVM